STMQSFNANANATAGPSQPRKPRTPFVSAEHRPERHDGRFRVVLITSGSVASVKMPDIVGALSRDQNISLQVVGTPSSLHFYSQESVDASVRASLGLHTVEDDVGVKVWVDADEWSDWKKVGDPILHIELRRWADLVVVAPCSADFLAKLAGGLCDNLALSILRALPPSTPTIICPAMNTHMYQHPFTADHLKTVQERLGYMVLGPQGTGKLACGDDGPGKMTDWREIVNVIEDFSAAFLQLQQERAPRLPSVPSRGAPASAPARPRTPPTPGRDVEMDGNGTGHSNGHGGGGAALPQRGLGPGPGPEHDTSMAGKIDVRGEIGRTVGGITLPKNTPAGLPVGPAVGQSGPVSDNNFGARRPLESVLSSNGGDGSAWRMKFWMG
ncbi:hypothetical protein JCM24511_01630, partial [Saitozyma sp. JCM 24511]